MLWWTSNKICTYQASILDRLASLTLCIPFAASLLSLELQCVFHTVCALRVLSNILNYLVLPILRIRNFNKCSRTRTYHNTVHNLINFIKNLKPRRFAACCCTFRFCILQYLHGALSLFQSYASLYHRALSCLKHSYLRWTVLGH